MSFGIGVIPLSSGSPGPQVSPEEWAEIESKIKNGKEEK